MTTWNAVVSNGVVYGQCRWCGLSAVACQHLRPAGEACPMAPPTEPEPLPSSGVPRADRFFDEEVRRGR